MEEHIRRLVYCSKSLLSPNHEFEQLFRILTGAILHNFDYATTGLLILTKGCFVQILEGPSVSVDKLMQSISRDKRHAQVTIIQIENNIQRSFPNWSMAYPTKIVGSENDLHEILEKSFAGDRTTGPEIQEFMKKSQYA